MMRIKRLIASVSAGFDDFVNKVENHEAVADCVIDDLRKATARVRVQQGRVEAQIARFEQRSTRLEEDEERWNQRAVAMADSDEAKALECVRRGQVAARERETLKGQIAEHRKVADELKSRLADLEQRLADFQLKRTSLSSRAARAQTLRATEGVCVSESVDAMFERWETAVLTDEYRDGLVGESADTLDREFRDEEEAVDLRARLDELKRGNAGSNAGKGKDDEEQQS